jgi:hypothetical protein
VVRNGDFGILAVYLNHYLWLVPIIGPMHGKVHPFPQFAASTTLLLLYWAVFRASYVLRAPKDERTSAFAGVLNIVLLGSVMRYQSAHPELAFWGLLILGAVEIVLGQLPNVRRKRTTFVVLNTIGVALLVAAIPLRFAPDYVSALWLVEAELLFFVGLFTRERLFRRLGTLTALATAIYLLGVHGARVLGDHLGGGDPVHHWTIGTIFAAATLILYADACWMPRRWPALFDDAIDRRAGQCLSYVAAATGIAGGWILFSGAGAALSWITLAVLLALIAWRFAMPDLTVQANIVAVLAVLRTLAVNLPSSSVAAHVPFGITYRLLTGSAIVGMLYLLSRWNRSNTLRFTTHLPGAVTWTASALASLLLWYELRPASVAIAWTMLGLLLLETGEARRSLNLRWQAYVALSAAFLRVFVVNLNAEQAGAAIGPRLYTVLPIALAFLYVHERLYTAGEGHERERQGRLPSVFAWLGALCFMALLRFELPTDAVATAWAALTLGFVALAWIADRRVFLHIGMAVSLATLGRAILHDLELQSLVASRHLAKLPQSAIDTELAGLSLLAGADARSQSVQQAVAQGTVAPELLTRLGWWAFRAHRLKDARTILEKASAIRPADDEIRNDLAWVDLEEGKDAQAKFEKVASSPDSILKNSTDAGAAINAWQLKKTDPALTEWQAVRLRNPQWRSASWRTAIYPPHIAQVAGEMEAELDRREVARLQRGPGLSRH